MSSRWCSSPALPLACAVVCAGLHGACVRADVHRLDVTSSGGAGDASGRGSVDAGLGGMAGVGGSPGIGGETGTGGAPGAGGVTGIGGAPGTGGARGIGGALGTGGTTPMPNMPGQLVITEIMADSTVAKDELGEWIEIYNPGHTTTFDLFGCQLFDSNNSEVINRHVTLAPEWFITMARSIDPSIGFIPTYNYTTVKLSNTGDRVGLDCGGVMIDLVDFATWPVPKGHSFSLNPALYDATSNDALASWCQGSTIYNTSVDGGTAETDYGTPGVTNPSCP